MKQIAKYQIFKIIILLTLYYCLLFWIYGNNITDRWSYKGLVNQFSEIRFYLSILGVALTIFTYIVIDKKTLPSALVMNLFSLLFFIPLYVFVAYTKIDNGFYLFLILYQLVLFLVYIFVPFSFRRIIPWNKIYFYIIIAFILVANLIINGYYNGFQIKIDLSDVYENRLAVRDMSLPSIVGYIKAFSYFVGIIALMYALKVRNWMLMIFVIVIQLMSFAFGAAKTQFLSIFICLIAFFFYSDKFRLWAPVSLVFILILSIIEYQYFSSTSITDIWTRRSLFVPAKISYNMYDFFEEPGREFLYLRGSILRFLGFDDPYAAQNGFQRMIGSLYGGSEDTNANTGLLGNDYAQFGWFSLLIFPLLRVYFLRMYDYCAIGIDKRIIVVLSIFIAFAYISGAFFTVLVTKGILLVNYLLYCFPRKNSRKQKEYRHALLAVYDKKHI